MNDLSRTENSKKNLKNGIVNQVVILLLTFISRTIFIQSLGVDYLGVNGLYSNILQLLSLTELGLSNIVLFTLYKPIAEKDEKKISKLINYYKKLYRIIFIVILVIGFLLVPLLPYLVNSNLNLVDLIGFYIISVINTALSYTFVYNRMLVTADQRVYIVKNVTTAITVIQNVIQIIILILFKNYYLYLLIQCIGTFFINFIIYIKAKKMYTFIDNTEELEQGEKREIIKSTKDLFVYRIGGVVVHSTDNIIISILLGTVFVGYYSNYYMIISAIINFVNILINSISASVGNLNASGNKQQQYKIFKHLIFLFQWIIGVLSLCMLFLFNDFIYIWLGSEFQLSFFTVLVLAINFYVQFIISPVWIYRESLGLYSKVKYLMLLTAIINIILSILFGLLLGMGGIFLATIVSRLLIVVIYEPIILYREYFNKNVKDYNNIKFVEEYIINNCAYQCKYFILKREI